MSEESFCHLFRKSIGVPLHKYITQVRLKEARRLLKYSSESISQIAYSVGYDDPLYFSRIFKRYYGVSPKFMRNNQG
jgi:AraC-like DNA-binding protein